MSALYTMRYVGQHEAGAGAIYIGRGVIVGVDVVGGRYKGVYTEADGRIKADVELTVPPYNVTLVTGITLPAGHKLALLGDWPSAFADGSPHRINIAGWEVSVVLDKIGDVP